MRQLTAIVLLLLYAFTSTELTELLKFPQLVKHYKEHQHIQKGITFSAFVHEHYVHGEVEDFDKEHDMKLPYKNFDITNAFSFTVLPTIISIELVSVSEFGFDKSPANKYTAIFSSSHCTAIWQPPKTV